MKYTAHTIKLQDGTLFSLKRRVRNHKTTLLYQFTKVNDGRSSQGKRHPLENILLILFCAITTGCTSITDCWRWAIHNRRLLKQLIDMPYGIPHPTTISYTLQVCDTGSLIMVWNIWIRLIYGIKSDTVVSLDGKTMRGVYGDGIIRHILSLFTHQTHQTIGQIGVSIKENEIPAALRLLEQTAVSGLTIIADALHTQKETVRAIRKNHAHYLLMVKENQRELAENIKVAFSDDRLIRDRAVDYQYKRGRAIETIVEISSDPDIIAYISEDWENIAAIGKVHRIGTRTARGATTLINETVFFISDRVDLTAKEASKIIRNHWKIENNLHWQKDNTFLEDRQTLRLGNAPQVMTFLKSMCIGLFSLFDFSSVTEAVANFRMNAGLHQRFLALTAVV